MAWISEIHYQDVYAENSDVSEFVEISMSPSDFARAGDFEFAAYQANGASSLVVERNLFSFYALIRCTAGFCSAFNQMLAPKVRQLTVLHATIARTWNFGVFQSRETHVIYK